MIDNTFEEKDIEIVPVSSGNATVMRFGLKFLNYKNHDDLEQLKQQILQDREYAKKYIDFTVGMNGEKLNLKGQIVKFIMWATNSDMFDKLFGDKEFRSAWGKVLKKLDEVG